MFTYSFAGSSFKLTESQATPAGGGTPDEIEMYYGRIPVIAHEIDPSSIAFFAGLDGGDGTYKATIKEPSITTKEEASTRALQELAFAASLVNGRFTTRTSLLSPGSVFQPGQLLTVNLPSHGIAEDAGFLIQEVGISMTEYERSGVTEYAYEVRFGGKQEFLESLAAEEGDVTEAEVVLTIESLADSFVTDDDAPTHSIITPPFQYGPSGSPVGKWGMAEWG